MLGGVEVEVVRSGRWPLVGKRQADVAEVLARPQRAVAASGEPMSCCSIAASEEIAAGGHPHRDVERSSGLCLRVVGDAFDLHRDAVVVDAIGQPALEVGRPGQRLGAWPHQEQDGQQPKQEAPQSIRFVHVNAPLLPCPVAPLRIHSAAAPTLH